MTPPLVHFDNFLSIDPLNDVRCVYYVPEEPMGISYGRQTFEQCQLENTFYA